MNKSKNGIYIEAGDTLLFEINGKQYSGGLVKTINNGIVEITPHGVFRCNEIDILDCVSKEFLDAISNLRIDDHDDGLFV